MAETGSIEKVSGSIAVPPVGAPQPTVAAAETPVDSCPMIGANQCSLGVLPVTGPGVDGGRQAFFRRR